MGAAPLARVGSVTVTAVLDSWAAMAMLDGEPAAARVRAAVEAGAVMSWINLGEVYYLTVRRRGEAHAQRAVEGLRARIRVDEPDGSLVLAAAKIKARGRMSYADAFCVATAQRHGLPVYTGDPEIVALDGEGLEVVDLRSAR
jgi:predicted nucleic acid-binding protein